MVFVFDLDDTICDTDGYSEKYILDFFKMNNWNYKQIAKDVRFAEKKFDWDMDTALHWYKTYGDAMMANFPCKEGRVDVLRILKSRGHRIVIATARATDWHTDPEGVTLKWLEDNEIPYDKLYVGRVDKEFICEEENADVFVDDDIDITGKVASHLGDKIKVFLSNTGYNKIIQTPRGVDRIDDFEDLLKL